MKLSCKVTQDLLPLYHDGICSGESRQLVEEHLETCADCKDVLKGLKDEIVLKEVDASKPLLSIKMTWNREKRKTLIRGIAITLLLCVVVFSAWWGLTQWLIIPVSGADLMSLESGQFEDGLIYVRYCQRFNPQRVMIKAEIDEQTGTVFFVTRRAILAKAYDLPTYNWAMYWFTPSQYDYTNAQGEPEYVTAAYLGSPDDPENAILIWQEGMEMPEPSDEAMEIWEMIHNPPEDVVEEPADLEPTAAIG